MAKTKAKSKKELLIEQISAAIGAGREVAVETVEFADPNRPRTCLEVDFPIIPINQIAAIEGNASKPIYQMSKWWARRRSSVFRSMLLAATTKAPDESKTAKAVWDVYYANHQKRGSLHHLKVADPFMGGGTTIVEGSRLGMQMFGCDLNPVAWFLVKNEIAQVDAKEVKRLLADVEADVKPLIMPYYTCDGPNGEKGKWYQRKGTRERKSFPEQLTLSQNPDSRAAETEDVWEELPATFDILSVPWAERKSYRYEGPEIVYTFWAKHGPCQREGCGHRTPIMPTPVAAIKTLTVDVWVDYECQGCRKIFDVERHAVRMAPDSPLFVAPNEKAFATMDDRGRFACPRCGRVTQDERAFVEKYSPELGKARNKKVELTLLVHPQWLAGCPKHDEEGREYGGSATDSVEATIRWNEARTSKLLLLEVRGTLPELVTCPNTGVTFFTDERGGTVPKKSTFACAADGSPNDVLSAIKSTGKTGPIAPYAIHGYSPKRDQTGQPYGGRFFAALRNSRQYNAAIREWDCRKDRDLGPYWPKSELPFGFMTHMNNGGLPNHGFSHWWKMFTPLQLLIHSQLLKSIVENPTASWEVKEFVLGAFQQYLRNLNLFCMYDRDYDKLVPALSNNNFHPKATISDNAVFSPLGRGNWVSCADGILEGLEWTKTPWEPVSPKEVERIQSQLTEKTDGKGIKVCPDDSVNGSITLSCGSASELSNLASASVDVVVTDPPFGGLLHYSELSDFFYVWLRLALRKKYPDLFEPEFVPKAQEAVANRARQSEDPDAFYQRILTDCWRETYRVLKPGGVLAFTFHHSEDEPWVGVLESLFDAGFYLEATYPIRGDETKGEGARPGTFGSMTIEYDIIHVCRKRVAATQAISWARLRRLIVDDVRRIKSLLSQHQKEGLPAADLQVIKRGKALEYFSRHYGKVYIEQGREFTIREALVGINQLLDDDVGATGGPEAPPSNAEPYTRQFFRIFYETTQVPRDQMQKFLRGTGIAPSDFEERGWCSEKNKVFVLTPPVALARAWKGLSRKGMARDFDQTMFLVGACVEGSNIRVMDTLDNPNFAPHPATAELVDWLGRHGGPQEIRFAAQRARTIYRDWLGKNKTKVQDQMKLFDLEA
jgi:putative DNA methylase